MGQKSVIRVVNLRTGDYIYTRTSNIKRRIYDLIWDIDSINGKANGVIHKRLEVFKDVEPRDPRQVCFEVYDFRKVIDQQTKSV